MEGLTEGRMVHYVLDHNDVSRIEQLRYATVDPRDDVVPRGVQIHMGNPVQAGEHCPMIVARLWDRSSDGPGTCNGQVILDGNDSLWVTSVVYDPDGTPGTWHWIERA